MRKLLFVFGFSSILLLAACGEEEIETNMSEKVADFTFTTQDNEELGLDDLKGEWWIADFIFTNCTTVCLPMTTNMAELQNKMNEKDLNAQLISFSVDPDYDSPEVLKEYGEGYGADFSNWSFLTGYDFETIKEFSTTSFRSLVQEPPPGEDQVSHGINFFLVNPDGDIVKKYDGVDVDEMDAIIDDLEIVLAD